MKKIICNKLYDTDSATLVKKTIFGFFGDPTGYEETLYQTESGAYFLYTNGGADSKYKSESIKRMSAEKAKAWLNN